MPRSTERNTDAPMAQLDYALIDVAFADNPKIIDLVETHGQLSELYIIRLILSMSRATRGEISLAAARGVGKRIGIAAPDDVLDYAVSTGVLSRTADGKITNSRVQDDQRKLGAKRESGSERQLRYRNREKSVTRDKRVTLPLQNRDSDTVTVSVLDLDLRSKKGGTGENVAPTADELHAALTDFSDYTAPASQSPWSALAESLLVPSSDPRVQGDSRFLSAAKRPLRDFPLLWLSVSEMCSAFELFTSAGLSLDNGDFKRVFTKANIQFQKREAQAAGSTRRVSAYADVTGWAMQRVLEELAAEFRFKRAKGEKR
jgi:hypothetical protein